jgi:hypothetical protein
MTRLFPKLTFIALAAGITTIWSVKKHVRHAHRQSASTGNRTAQAARN